MTEHDCYGDSEPETSIRCIAPPSPRDGYVIPHGREDQRHGDRGTSLTLDLYVIDHEDF